MRSDPGGEGPGFGSARSGLDSAGEPVRGPHASAGMSVGAVSTVTLDRTRRVGPEATTEGDRDRLAEPACRHPTDSARARADERRPPTAVTGRRLPALDGLRPWPWPGWSPTTSGPLGVWRLPGRRSLLRAVRFPQHQPPDRGVVGRFSGWAPGDPLGQTRSPAASGAVRAPRGARRVGRGARSVRQRHVHRPLGHGHPQAHRPRPVPGHPCPLELG